MAHRDRAAGPPSRRSPAAADGATTQSVYPALSRSQLEILNVLRSAGGFLLLADLLVELRWRGAVQWQGTTNGAINAELETTGGTQPGARPHEQRAELRTRQRRLGCQSASDLSDRIRRRGLVRDD